MKQSLFPLSAFKYDEKIIEIREVMTVEMSAIIHCALEEYFIKVNLAYHIIYYHIFLWNFIGRKSPRSYFFERGRGLRYQ